MTDHMKEAERLADEYAKAVHDGRDRDCQQTRAALLAHIQRGAVPDGWQLVPKEPTKDMVEAAYENATGGGGRAAIYAAMLAAAPAPDHSALSADRLWPVDGLYPDMLPPATSKERWMFDQGRLAERRIAMDAMRGEVKP